MIRFKCAGCRCTLQVKLHVAGRRIACPRCQHVNQVPTASGGPPEFAAAAPAAQATESARLPSVPHGPRMSTLNSPLPLGFPAAPAAAKQVPVTKPTPLPRRPKGRWFIGFLLVAACAYAGYQVWDNFFRYSAYGTVTGKIVELSPPWEGDLAFLHIREGDRVRQGDVLVTMENHDLRQRQEQVVDELRLAQATLEADAVRLKWLAAFQMDHSQSAVARHQEALGQLEVEKAQLAKLASEKRTAAELMRQKAIAPAEYERLQIEFRGQAEKVTRLDKALAEATNNAVI